MCGLIRPAVVLVIVVVVFLVRDRQVIVRMHKVLTGAGGGQYRGLTERASVFMRVQGNDGKRQRTIGG